MERNFRRSVFESLNVPRDLFPIYVRPHTPHLSFKKNPKSIALHLPIDQIAIIGVPWVVANKAEGAPPTLDRRSWEGLKILERVLYKG